MLLCQVNQRQSRALWYYTFYESIEGSVYPIPTRSLQQRESTFRSSPHITYISIYFPSVISRKPSIISPANLDAIRPAEGDITPTTPITTTPSQDLNLPNPDQITFTTTNQETFASPITSERDKEDNPLTSLACASGLPERYINPLFHFSPRSSLSFSFFPFLPQLTLA